MRDKLKSKLKEKRTIAPKVFSLLSAFGLVLILLFTLARSNFKQVALVNDESRRKTIVRVVSSLNAYFTDNGYYVGSLGDLPVYDAKQVSTVIYKAYDINGSTCSTKERNCMNSVVYGVYELPKMPCSKGKAYLGWTSAVGTLGKICSTGIPSYTDTPTTVD